MTTYFRRLNKDIEQMFYARAHMLDGALEELKRLRRLL